MQNFKSVLFTKNNLRALNYYLVLYNISFLIIQFISALVEPNVIILQCKIDYMLSVLIVVCNIYNPTFVFTKNDITKRKVKELFLKLKSLIEKVYYINGVDYYLPT